LGVAALILSAGGCSRTFRPDQADRGEQVPVDELLHGHLYSQPAVTVAEACRVVLLLADGEEQFADYPARYDALVERGIIRPAWGLTREECVDRGTLAYMIYRVLELRGGVNMAVLGRLGIGDRRYATKELSYRGLIPQGSAHVYVSGAEFMDIIGRTDRYMAEHDMYEIEQVDLPGLVGTGQADGAPGTDSSP
jgi:hypothetical protein